jgi:hypothetical protein
MVSLARLVLLSSFGISALVPPGMAQSISPHKVFERSFYINDMWNHPAFQSVAPPKSSPETPALILPEIKVEANPKPIVQALVPRIEPVVVAQAATPPQLSPPSAAPGEPPAPIFSPRIGIRYNSEGSGINQFVGIEGFVPLAQKPAQKMTFLEGRALYDTDSQAFGGNIIIGHRSLNKQTNRVIGGYLAYDNRDTGNTVVNQIGAGVESIGNDSEVRLNAYLPIGKTRYQLGESFGAGSFQQNVLLVDRVRQFEAALAGVDLEYGHKLANIGREGSLRGYAGLYYYAGNGGQDTLGQRIRLVARVNEYTSVGFALQEKVRNQRSSVAWAVPSNGRSGLPSIDNGNRIKSSP